MNPKAQISCKLMKKTSHFSAKFSFPSHPIGHKSDHSPSPRDLNSCISSLKSSALHKNLSRGKEIHSWMVINGFLNSPSSITSLINMYSKCNRPIDALTIFDQTSDRNLFNWNAIISGFVTNNLSKEAIDFYYKLRRENIFPDRFTFPSVIKACSDILELEQGKKIHADLMKIGCEFDVFVASALINLYLKFNLTGEARWVFDEMSERDVVLWNAMINGYAQIGEFDLALEVFGRMTVEGVTPGKFTVTGVLSIFSMSGKLGNGRIIHGFVVKIGYESDVVVLNSLIDMYGKCESIGDAREIFELMPERDIFSWNSILSVHEQSGDHDGTLRLFDRMQSAGFRPDSITISTVLPACSHMAALMHGREIHGYMIVNGLRKNDVFVENAIMDMYAKCGSLIEARLVFDGMRDKDVASWNIMIMGYGLHGHGDEALDVFYHMCGVSHLKPDEVTFVGVLSACSHAGLVGPGSEILRSMERAHGVVPTVEHYACAVDMLGRAGQLEKAYELALNMPIEPNPVVWRAFLASCRLHGDAARAEVAACQLFELDPEHCGSYVLLSNVYGAAGRYEDVSEVRRTMIRRNVRKSPGCSWIELNTGVHVFVTGDRTHPESNRIYAELDSLIGRLCEYGYAPSVTHIAQEI
ncbi:pentatricopeptide repeat (PPR) superfamily protein [Tasmannia lanceolata]|uniref:pentatricopeptide repeat (PPR) superfamily protein n=1 Tax=Tasmannia lanceolata TaxID=3420 RepID=UPI004063C42A